MKKHYYCLAILISQVLVTALSAGTFPILPTTVAGTDVFSGPSFTLTSTVLPTDLLSLTVRGEVFLQAGNTYGTNAAGIVTTAGTSPVGGNSTFGGLSFGAIVLGNSTLGFHTLFPTNAANGFGSGTPPSSLSLSNVAFSSLGFASPLNSGTVLEFRTVDGNNFDNAGSFTVSGQIVTAEMPEPSSLILMGAGLAGLVFWRRRLC